MGSPDQMQQATEGLARELKAALGWHGSTVLKTLPLNSRLFGAIEPEMCAGNHLRCALIAKETYSFCKRDLFTRQKRPIHMANETCSCGKRALFTCASLQRNRLHRRGLYGRRGLFT